MMKRLEKQEAAHLNRVPFLKGFTMGGGGAIPASCSPAVVLMEVSAAVSELGGLNCEEEA